jgi:ApbE superfamily uncharacterized protein (UPF0280 family)
MGTKYHPDIIFLDDRTIQAECGPMRLTIQTLENGRPGTDLARRAAAKSVDYLTSVADSWKVLCQPVSRIEKIPEDRLARRMIDSARLIGDDNLTPMATVAGTISDAVADWIYRHGGTRVVVDNGGDIAIRLDGAESVTVGVKTHIQLPDINRVLTLDTARPTWGVATSGFGGRSFTKGIASSVTVVADRASPADAAATAIANACTVDDKAIIRVPAEQIDPNTDIAGTEVTVKIGRLSPGKKQVALDRACLTATMLEEKNVILGTLIALDDQTIVTPGLKNLKLGDVLSGS